MCDDMNSILTLTRAQWVLVKFSEMFDFLISLYIYIKYKWTECLNILPGFYMAHYQTDDLYEWFFF